MKHLRSLREFLDKLEKIGELQSIDKEVDWKLEIGAVARRSYELRAPAPLFNTITGIDEGFRVLAAPGGLSAHCLLADRFPADERPVASDFAHNWSAETQQHVLDNWQKYGYR